MPRRFFRKFAIKREWFRSQWYLAPFDHLLHDRSLWGIRRRTVVPAFAIGLFVAFVPFPGHTLLVVLLAMALRVNIPIAVLSTLVCNPLTMGPMFYFAYRVGFHLLGMEPQPFEFELSIKWVTESFGAIWQPLVFGSLLLGSTVAMLGYVSLDLLWRASIADYVAKKRQRRRSS